MSRWPALLPILLLACADKGGGEGADDTSTPADDTAETADPGPDFDCPEATTGLQDVTTTPASPYLIVHPTASAEDVSGHVVLFLGGGPSDNGSANIAFNAFMSRGDAVGSLISAMPYTSDSDLSDEGDRVAAVAQEVLDCWGGEPGKVHLAGTSNGGRAAFAIMLEQPDTFATLLGAPGYFQESDTSVLAAQLAGKAVFNGVGEEDDAGWQEAVYSTHETLTSLGVESVYEEFEGQGHIPDESFDPSALFEFWTSHGG